MRVIHVGTGSMPIRPSGSGAVEKVTFFLVKNLSKIGCDINVIDIHCKTPGSLPVGVTIQAIWNPPISGRVYGTASHVIKVSIFSILAGIRLRRLMREGKIDVIHTHGQFPAAATLLFKRLFGWKTPVVHTIHNAHILMHPSKANRLKYFLEVFALNKSDLIIVETETGFRQLRSQFNIRPGKIRVIPQGIDLQMIKGFVQKNINQNSRYDGYTVLNVGRVRPRKNQLAIIKAAPRVLKRFPRTRFVFVGPIEDNNYYRKILQMIDAEKIGSHVEFMGEVTENALFEAYKNATIFAFPTLYETQGVVLLEAMAFGLPVVASGIGPIRDVVSLEDDSALLVDPQDVDAIADAIMRLLEDDSLREKLAARGKSLVSKHFSWKEVANRMLRVYKNLVKSQKERKEGS